MYKLKYHKFTKYYLYLVTPLVGRGIIVIRGLYVCMSSHQAQNVINSYMNIIKIIIIIFMNGFHFIMALYIIFYKI